LASAAGIVLDLRAYLVAVVVPRLQLNKLAYSAVIEGIPQTSRNVLRSNQPYSKHSLKKCTEVGLGIAFITPRLTNYSKEHQSFTGSSISSTACGKLSLRLDCIAAEKPAS
jgi:hypothetical protein